MLQVPSIEPSSWKKPADALLDAIRAVEHAPPPPRELVPDLALCWGSFPYFISQLRDDKGQPLGVWWHIKEFANLMAHNRLLALLAARDHAKTWTVWEYILWKLWRHNRNPDGSLKPGTPDGNFEFVYFTANNPLAIERFQRLEQFILDNLHLFGDVVPQREPGQPMAALREQWSKTKFRLRNGAQGTARSIGSATRGLHPDLVVADDIVSDKNSTTPLQRGRVWSYFVGTIMPMAGPHGQIILMGTPQHYTDTLFKIRGAPGWKHIKFRAVDWDTETVLWPERYSLQSLRDIQQTDPLLFAREYQMDPRDDASSIFPYSLTAKPVERGAVFGYMRPFPPTLRNNGDFVVLAEDLAISESVGADYTFAMVALYNRFTQQRRMLWMQRERGLTFDGQVSLLRDLCRDFNVDVGVIEDNVFQKWLRQHVTKYPETATRIYGHTTGVEKQSMVEGIPGLKIILENDLWTIPVNGEREKELADIWRSELNAYGWQNGKLGGIGEHDDSVTAFWLVERAIRLIEYHLARAPEPIVTGEEVGMGRVTISDY